MVVVTTVAYKRELKRDLIQIRQNEKYSEIKPTLREAVRYIERLERALKFADSRKMRARSQILPR